MDDSISEPLLAAGACHDLFWCLFYVFPYKFPGNFLRGRDTTIKLIAVLSWINLRLVPPLSHKKTRAYKPLACPADATGSW